MAAASWQWPAGRAIVLYLWSWFDPELGDVVSGWSQRGTVDEAGYVHFEEEAGQPRRSVEVDMEGMPVIEAHTFSPMTYRAPPILLGGARWDSLNQRRPARTLRMVHRHRSERAILRSNRATRSGLGTMGAGRCVLGQ